MTPMKKFSTGLTELKDTSRPYFKEVTLNRAAPGYSRYSEDGYTKGVEHDFVLIMASHDKEISFGLSFDYVDRPSTAQIVIASIKKGQNNTGIVSSMPMLLDVFKNRLNDLNKYFRTYPAKASQVSILEKFAEVFLEEKLDLNKEIREADKKLSLLVQEKEAQYKVIDLKNAYDMTESDLTNTRKMIKSKLASTPEAQELKELEARVAALKSIVIKKEKTLQKEYHLKDHENNNYEARAKYLLANDKAVKAVQEELKKLPTIVSKHLKYGK